MNFTLIEKIKDFLYVGNYLPDEEPGFGIIEVCPHICPGDIELTKKRAILESHHLSEYSYKIVVRSRSAEEDITNILIQKDFPYQVKKNNLSVILRQWYTTSEKNLLRYLKSDNCIISVTVEEDRLEEFIKMIGDLRKTHSYRNIYLTSDEIFQVV